MTASHGGGAARGRPRAGRELGEERDWRWGRGPAVTWVPSLHRYLMAYTAYGPLGPRVAVALRCDLVQWERLGPVSYAYDPLLGVDFRLVPNKDAMFFPEPVPGPDGEPSYAMLHRPMWDLSGCVKGPGNHCPAVWAIRGRDLGLVCIGVRGRRRLRAITPRRAPAGRAPRAAVGEPEDRWRHGASARGGWMADAVPRGRRGVRTRARAATEGPLAAGALVLDAADVSRVLARSATPLRSPNWPWSAMGSSRTWSFRRPWSSPPTPRRSCSTGWPTHGSGWRVYGDLLRADPESRARLVEFAQPIDRCIRNSWHPRARILSGAHRSHPCNRSSSAGLAPFLTVVGRADTWWIAVAHRLCARVCSAYTCSCHLRG